MAKDKKGRRPLSDLAPADRHLAYGGMPRRGSEPLVSRPIRMMPSTWAIVEAEAKSQGISIGAAVELMILRCTAEPDSLPSPTKWMNIDEAKAIYPEAVTREAFQEPS